MDIIFPLVLQLVWPIPFDFERSIGYIQQVLAVTNGKIHGPGGAAELMAINPSTLRSKISKLGIRYTRKS